MKTQSDCNDSSVRNLCKMGVLEGVVFPTFILSPQQQQQNEEKLVES